MFGDTHVEPEKLFDPASSGPPEDALDVQFVVPTSLSLYGDALARTPEMAHQLPELAGVYERVLAKTVADLQQVCGYVTHPAFTTRTAARLAMTAVSENSVPSESIMRIHGHVYIGRTARTLRDGSVQPVDLAWLRQFVRDVWANYMTSLRSATTETFGLTWGPLPGHHPSDQEIVEPPFAPHVAQWPAPDTNACPGRFGPHERIMADQRWRIGIAESQIRVQSEQRWAG